jgi:hypothetical protein
MNEQSRSNHIPSPHSAVHWQTRTLVELAAVVAPLSLSLSGSCTLLSQCRVLYTVHWQVRTLVELGADVDAFVADGVGTALHAAALTGRSATVRVLVQLGATLGVQAKTRAETTRRGERPGVRWPRMWGGVRERHCIGCVGPACGAA